ncbi:MAG TPA: GatB/YqeY domain-containing protein [Candidatus Eremiobacteraceae bacterium]|nr:GatB/YqeY domain-containing protein [Candidatus Eremiobacteraceae bacterium]
MPSILERLNADLKSSMKARDAERTDTIRMAISAMKYKQIDAMADLAEKEQEEVLRKQVKQRDDSIEQYAKAGRTDLADKESRERVILMEYLPKELSPDEIRAHVGELVRTLPEGAKFPEAIKAAMAALKDKAPGKSIQEAVRAAMDARSAS